MTTEEKSKIKTYDIELDYDLTKLKPDPQNPNEMTEAESEAHEKSLIERGMLSIILVDQNDVIVNGTHTVKKLIKNGTTRGPIIRKHYKNDVDKKIDRQILNYGPTGHPNKDKQIQEIVAIYKETSMDNFAILMNSPKDEFLQLIANEIDLVPTDIIPGKPTNPKTKKSQVWKLGNHRLMCGDSLNGDVLTLIESDNPRLVFTDPPYDLEEYDYLIPFLETYKDIEVLILNGDIGTKNLLLQYDKFFKGFYIITFNSPSRFPNQPMISHRLISHFRKGKSNFQNLRDAFGTVHELVLRKDGLTRHEKPVDLPRKFIIHYTKLGEQVLDLFGSSGSTLIACELTGRNCLMMEKDPGCCDIIIKRWEELTHEKAVLI